MESQRPRVEARESLTGISCKVGDLSALNPPECEFDHHWSVLSGAFSSLSISVTLYPRGAFRDGLLNSIVEHPAYRASPEQALSSHHGNRRHAA